MEISEKTLQFIQAHCNDDVNALRLKYAGKSKEMDIPLDFALLQIEARRKALKKIPSFLQNPLFIFPDVISAEQATNETVARFHASLLLPGSCLLDLTGGLGIDDMTFASMGIHVTSCEIDTNKSMALKHNVQVLEIDHFMNTVNTDSMQYVRNCRQHFDIVFSDPARRTTTGKRLHALSECQPDILERMTDIMRITDRLIIKSSPLLDLTLIRDTVGSLSHLYVVSLKGECKEVLIDIEKGKDFSGVSVIDLDSDGIISEFIYKPTRISNTYTINYAEHKNPSDYKYLYEPNAGIMKTGAWGELCFMYPELKKADPNTHLFLSDTLILGFPGRIITIGAQPDKKALNALKSSRCNVVARNYPLKAPEIEKRFFITPGGEKFLYAFKYQGNPVCILGDQVRTHRQSQE